MLKVLIVDDEMLVRVGMRSLIQWEEHGFEVIGDAADGQAALAWMEAEVPDIVLTDIVMPGKDGLWLIGEARKKWPDVRFIVLSSYSDFDYVREAMKLGVDDYVLKTSVRPEEFLKILNETRQKVERDRKKWKHAAMESPSLSETKQRQFLRLLVEASPDEAALERYRSDLDWPDAACAAVFFVRIHHYSKLGPDGKSVGRSLFHLLEQETREAERKQVFQYKENELAAALFFKDRPQAQLLRDMGRDAVRAARRLINASISVGISEPFDRFEDFPQAVKQAREAVRRSFYEGIERCYKFEPLPAGQADRPYLRVEDELLQRIEVCDREGVGRVLERFFADLAEQRRRPERRRERLLDIVQQFKIAARKWNISWHDLSEEQSPVYVQMFELETLDDTAQWFEKLSDKVIGAISGVRSQTYREEISRLIDYLKTHFTENVTLSSASKYVNMSESYLSSMFKKETKMSFVEYLTKLRIEKAAELLKTTDWPSYAIAEKVGYENINYFGRSFKKVMGMSPSRFRGQFLHYAEKSE